MHRWLVIAWAAVLIAACEYHSKPRPAEFPDSGNVADDGGITFSRRDAGSSSSSSSSGSSGSSSSGSTSGTTGSGSTGSSGSSGSSGGVDAGPADAGFVDLDQDGLDDRYEAQIVRDYLPYISLESSDPCPLGGLLYRVSPHPQDSNYLHVIIDHLYQNDCGTLNPHLGDHEVIAMTIDPRVPPPDGVVYVVAISKQGPNCATRTTTCTTRATPTGPCQGVAPCDLGNIRGTDRPVVYTSRGHHGSYLDLNSCGLTCFDQCALSNLPDLPPIQNAGEPGAHLTDNLTDGGFVNSINGWTEASLMNYDPWGDAGFGGSGPVEPDLTDPALDTPICP